MEKLKIAFYVLSTLIGIFFGVQMMREQDRINHRLDVRDAYFNKGLIDGAKERERVLNERTDQLQAILEHCKRNPCNLPVELTIIKTHQLTSLEEVLTQVREK